MKSRKIIIYLLLMTILWGCSVKEESITYRVRQIDQPTGMNIIEVHDNISVNDDIVDVMYQLILYYNEATITFIDSGSLDPGESTNTGIWAELEDNSLYTLDEQFGAATYDQEQNTLKILMFYSITSDDRTSKEIRKRQLKFELDTSHPETIALELIDSGDRI